MRAMNAVETSTESRQLRQSSRPLRLSACSVLFLGTIVGGFILVMWGLTSGTADDFINGRAYDFLGFVEPGSEIGFGVIFISVIISWLILRKVYSKLSRD